jgi:hypothetical protein
MLQEGPLQKALRHPRYVDILAKCIREPFIAHMGKFDEMEFCLWLVTETEYHPTEGDEDGDDVRRPNDRYKEHSLTSSLLHFFSDRRARRQLL